MNCACGATLGLQPGLPGTNTVTQCIRCLTRDRIAHLLTMLPDEGTDDFDDLSEFEQQFLPSARAQFERQGTLSEKQIDILERIYAK